jgi:hypothetical protein
MQATSVAYCNKRCHLINIDLEKPELFTGQFYPLIPNKGHKSLKSFSIWFEFSTLGTTKPKFLKMILGVPVSFFYKCRRQAISAMISKEKRTQKQLK